MTITIFILFELFWGYLDILGVNGLYFIVQINFVLSSFDLFFLLLFIFFFLLRLANDILCLFI
jgi:hypothetical protein